MTTKKNDTARNILLFLALLAQMSHAAAVFYRMTGLEADAPNGIVALHFLQAIVYAVALEGAIAYFVHHKRRSEMVFFMVVSMAHNVLYYYKEGMTAPYVAAMWLVSLSLPVAIWRYSVEDKEEKKEPSGKNEEVVIPQQAPRTQERVTRPTLATHTEVVREDKREGDTFLPESPLLSVSQEQAAPKPTTTLAKRPTATSDQPTPNERPTRLALAPVKPSDKEWTVRQSEVDAHMNRYPDSTLTELRVALGLPEESKGSLSVAKSKWNSRRKQSESAIAAD